MTQDRWPAPDDDTAGLARLLKEEAGRYHPDNARILRTVRTGLAREAGASRGGGRRWSWIAPLGAVAATAAVVVVAVLLTALPGRPSTNVAGPRPAAGPLHVQPLPTERPYPVALSATGYRDWFVSAAGDRSTSLKGGRLLGTPQFTGDPVYEPTDGPYEVSWHDGLPLPAQGRTRRWLTVSARDDSTPGGVEIRVEAAADRHQLQVWAGTSRTAATLTVLVDGTVVGTGAMGSDGRALPSVVTVDLAGIDPAAQVVVRLLAGPGGAVSVAAAALT